MRPQREGEAFAPEEHRISKIPNQVETCGSVFVSCSLISDKLISKPGPEAALAGLYAVLLFQPTLKTILRPRLLPAPAGVEIRWKAEPKIPHTHKSSTLDKQSGSLPRCPSSLRCRPLPFCRLKWALELRFAGSQSVLSPTGRL